MNDTFLRKIIQSGTWTTQIVLITLSILLVWIFNQFDFLNILTTERSEFKVNVSRFEISLILVLLFLNVFVSYSLLKRLQKNSRLMQLSTSVIIFTLLVICIWVARVFNFSEFITQAESSIEGGVNRLEVFLMVILLLVGIMATLTLFKKYNKVENIVVMSAYSKKVQYNGEWVSVEKYIQNELGVKISHGITPDEKDQVLKDFKESMAQEKTRA